MTAAPEIGRWRPRWAPRGQTVARRVVALAGCAALLSLPAAPVPAQSIGRLFSTVEERIALDEVREEYEYGKPPPRKAPAPRPVAGPAAPVVPQVTVNGIVVRSSGNNASWINGASIFSGEATPEGIRVEPSAAAGGLVRLILPSGLDPIRIKPGQKIDVVTGNVVDAYQLDAREATESVFEKEPPAAPAGEPGSEAR